MDSKPRIDGSERHSSTAESNPLKSPMLFSPPQRTSLGTTNQRIPACFALSRRESPKADACGEAKDAFARA